MQNKISSSGITGKFIGSINFQLRTLLNGFSGPLQLLKFQTDDPDLIEVFRMFDISIDRLQRLAIRASIVSDIEQKVDFEKKPVDIVDIVRYTVLDMQTFADLGKISLNVESDPQNISVDGNHDLLVQVFQVILELLISLSIDNSQVIVDFKTINEGVLCRILSPTANLPSELNTNSLPDAPDEIVSWDIELVKKIILFHKATIRTVLNNGICNELQIIFEK